MAALAGDADAAVSDAESTGCEFRTPACAGAVTPSATTVITAGVTSNAFL
jgi:hypothetical protein